MDKLYHRGVMRTRCDDCQFVCVTQADYFRIQHQGEENILRHEEDGQIVMVVERRETIDGGSRRGHVVIRVRYFSTTPLVLFILFVIILINEICYFQATPDRLMLQLIEENSITDPTYVEDFLLTHRTFIENPILVANQLLLW